MANQEINREQQEDVVDVEALVKSGQPVPKGKKYLIRIDREKFEWPQERITGAQILALVHKDPSRFMVVQRLRDGRTEKVELNEAVDLTGPGIERFSTLPLDQTEGAF
jgi:hypothetical protein